MNLRNIDTGAGRVRIRDLGAHRAVDIRGSGPEGHIIEHNGGEASRCGVEHCIEREWVDVVRKECLIDRELVVERRRFHSMRKFIMLWRMNERV